MHTVIPEAATHTKPAPDRYSPVKPWWVWLVDLATKAAVLYPCDTEAQAEALRAELDAEAGDWAVAGRTLWRVNEWNARRMAALRGWAVVAVS